MRSIFSFLNKFFKREESVTLPKIKLTLFPLDRILFFKLYKNSSEISKQIILVPFILTNCFTNSDPIDPPAPVTKIFLFSSFLKILFFFLFLSLLKIFKNS